MGSVAHLMTVGFCVLRNPRLAAICGGDFIVQFLFETMSSFSSVLVGREMVISLNEVLS